MKWLRSVHGIGSRPPDGHVDVRPDASGATDYLYGRSDRRTGGRFDYRSGQPTQSITISSFIRDVPFHDRLKRRKRRCAMSRRDRRDGAVW